MGGLFAGSDTELTGATDGTNIGNVGDRLKVDSVFNAVPKSDVSYFSSNLANGAAVDMNIDGSITSQQFTYSPASTLYINRLYLVMSDDKIKRLNRFGDITITNGFLIQTSINGTVRTLMNILTNPQIGAFFKVNSFAGDQLGADKPIVYATYDFNPVLTLSNATSDYIRATVRDDLTGLRHLRMRVSGWQEV